jgi:hypothetical protein
MHDDCENCKSLAKRFGWSPYNGISIETFVFNTMVGLKNENEYLKKRIQTLEFEANYPDHSSNQGAY